MKRRIGKNWIPLWIDKWIFGSTRHELLPDEQSVWIDFLVLAAKDNGYIRANEEIPYPIEQLSGLLLKPKELLERTIQKCLKYDKIEVFENGIMRIKNWEKYQLSDRWEREFKNNNSANSEVTSAKSEATSLKTELTSKKEEVYRIEENRIEENNITPLTPQNNQGGCGYVDNSVDKTEKSEQNSKIVYNDKKLSDSSKTKNANGVAFNGDMTHFKDKLVNWSNAKTDNQKFIAYWLEMDNPNLYKTATSSQIKGIYGRFAKSSKAILDIAGDLETAKEAAKLCREWLISRKLDYTLETISKHLHKFVEMLKRKEILPPEIDVALWSEYCELREIKKGKFDKTKVIDYLKQEIYSGKNPNKIIENRIIELKHDNSNIPDVIKNINIKTIKE